ncbi:hypothetical protein TNCV_3645151 [Trichonephila clavipes]|nr:hypothetical protein TNCV_3645151 [Trichonephila clavipes]
MLEKVIENWTSRLDYIRASRGSPMPEIIFKMSLPNLQGVPNVVYKLGGEVENILRSHNYIGNHERKRNPNEIRDTNSVFEIAAIGLYVRITWTRHGLKDMFENTVRVSRIVTAAMDICATRSISEFTVVSSIVALKYPGSNIPQRAFNDSVAASLDIFPHTTE